MISNSNEESTQNRFEKFYYHLGCFIFYSFVGWLIEMVYHLGKGIVEDRGFLFGPFCVMYGFGVLIMLELKKRINFDKKLYEVPFLWCVFFVVCSLFEYVTSYLLEIIFGIRLWDYTGLSYNWNGRVRLITSIAWSNCGVVLCYFLQPRVKDIYEKFKKKSKRRLFGLIYVMGWIMFIDAMISIVCRL